MISEINDICDADTKVHVLCDHINNNLNMDMNDIDDILTSF